ncbi:response regulator [Duncaniella muris]|uniref:response regulator n=1 Tax=Duncaniella muris TaxID=2094150 RepID=UPI002711E6E8|nr:response regulator transcription factor [Duncaniella muris]
MKILLVDDHDIVLRGMRHLIEDILGEECHVDGAMTAAEALSQTSFRTYDLCLLDVELPDAPGITHLRKIRQICPGIKIIVNTIHEELWIIKDYFDAGVEGILFKDVLSSEIATAIRRVADGGTYFCKRAEQLRRLIETYEMPSPKELEVLRLIASGKKTDDIAAEMGLSSNTIETHRRHLLSKLHARNSAELVLNAVNHGLLPTSRI